MFWKVKWREWDQMTPSASGYDIILQNYGRFSEVFKIRNEYYVTEIILPIIIIMIIKPKKIHIFIFYKALGIHKLYSEKNGARFDKLNSKNSIFLRSKLTDL